MDFDVEENSFKYLADHDFLNKILKNINKANHNYMPILLIK